MALAFFGVGPGGGAPVTLFSFNASNFTFSPTAATAGMTVSNTGAHNRIQGGSSVSQGTWLLSGSAGDYDVRARIDGGSWGSWLNLATSRTWTITSIGGFVDQDVDLEIRLAVSPFTVYSSSSHYFQVEMAI